jgi:predicted small integral membrane protein
MTLTASLLIFKLTLLTGLAAWLTIVIVNNVTAFHGGVAAIGGLMSMQLFQEAPAIASPLLSRRVTSGAWHRLVYSFVLLVEVGVAILLWLAIAGIAGTLIDPSGSAAAITRANLALTAFVAMGFVMAIGGAWFGYYIRQEGMQITHLALIVLAVVALIAVNIGMS